MIMHTIFRLAFAIVILTNAVPSQGQLLNKKGEEVAPYYINFDAASGASVTDVRGEYLHFSYRDRIGTANAVSVSIFDSKHQLVKKLTLAKEFGLNYFDIKLAGYGITLNENETYLCVLTDEKEKQEERIVRYLPEVKIEIGAQIMVKPKHLECTDQGSNLVEFYGDISGGQAPYKVSWFVMNARRTDFLYQPVQSSIPIAGLTSSIQVDKNPEYVVLLYVTDACGNEQTSTVQIVCEKRKKKVNTLFFQRLDDALINVNKIETTK
jgi:hypothetical protein